MKAKNLYVKLDEDFGVDSLIDDWSFMRFNDYIFPGFKDRYIGLVLDNTDEVKKVYTATMPDLDILDLLFHKNENDLLLFSHHAMGYNPNIPGFPFYDIPEDYLSKLKQQRISFYVLHVPLDKNGEYSTSVSLAKHLNLEIIDGFCEYIGIQCGVVCKTDKKTATELAEYVGSRVGHEVKLIRNGSEVIKNGRVAIAAGGGSVDFVAKELADLGINMYITGNTRKMPSVEPIMEFHRIIEEYKINVIGATHYTTEKYACIEMVRYFEKLGVPAGFLEGKHFREDL
jgi:putative NIF3 family GTP cyclohydrolase 1 type 2